VNSVTLDADRLTAVSGMHRIWTVLAILVPFAGLIVACIGLWDWGFSWVDFVLLVVMYTATGLGITIGYHRLFTHRAFETVPVIRFLLAILGSMAVEGPVLRWVATHRRHHQHSDQTEDPHSPHQYGDGFLSVIAGWWHAHVGWIFASKWPGLDCYIKDLQRDRMIRLVNRSFGVWVAVGLILPAAAGGLLTGTWRGAFLGFLWGGLVRVFLVHHVTWSVNSVCHLWGARSFLTGDKSRNNVICGVLAFGEGWHNNHHAYPRSARHGFYWWQLDMSYWVIRGLAALGLARRVRVPDRRRMALRRHEAAEATR